MDKRTSLLEQLLILPEPAAQQTFLTDHADFIDAAFADAIRNEVIRLYPSDLQQALQVTNLIYFLADQKNDEVIRAFAYWAEALVRSLAVSEYVRALELYDQALHRFRLAANEFEQARIQITRVWSLASVGRYAEAFADGDWALQVLLKHERWRGYAILIMNLASIHSRLGDYHKALAMMDEAQQKYRQLGMEREILWAQAEQNRSLYLRNLGKFEASLQASRIALTLFERLGAKAEIARTQQNLGITYLVMGNYNEALKLLEIARDLFLSDERQRDAVLAEKYLCDCLLQLRRFDEVLIRTEKIRKLFIELNTPLEVAHATLNEAMTLHGLQRFEAAHIRLREARNLYLQNAHETWVAMVDLERASLHYDEGHFLATVKLAEASGVVFAKADLPIQLAQAYLMVAQAHHALQRHEQSESYARQALSIGDKKDNPFVLYSAHYRLGTILSAKEQFTEALQAFDAGMFSLERLRSRLMIEHRANFVADKQLIYEESVALCLQIQQPQRAWAYVERAKSRSLSEMLAHRLDLGIQVRQASDRPLVDELLRLRQERDQLYRHWESGEEAWTQRGPITTSREQFEKKALILEGRITELWHKLLIHNADYARDAVLWQTNTAPLQPQLETDTILLEYFFVKGQPIVFTMTDQRVQAHPLATDQGQLNRLIRLLWLNLSLVTTNQPQQITALTEQAQMILAKLADALITPIAQQIAHYQRLVIVPHGQLHYVPFHALFSAQAYLIQTHTVSYLPGASILHYCREVRPHNRHLLAVGHSMQNRLPHTITETQAVTALLPGHLLLHGEASVANVRQLAPNFGMIHLATHGEFRADNPLFSGLCLEDGWLTVLDIFGLDLKAALVTLSACQTGRHLIGGGDELFGLMRAFFHAGTAALAMTLWSVEDQATALLMQTFYRHLASGARKDDAMRAAQLVLLESVKEHPAYAHPYFWAAFCLVGDMEKIF